MSGQTALQRTAKPSNANSRVKGARPLPRVTVSRCRPSGGYRRDPHAKLAGLRAESPYDERELAERPGVPLRTLQRIEPGDVPNSILQLVALADSLDCTLNHPIEQAWHRFSPVDEA